MLVRNDLGMTIARPIAVRDGEAWGWEVRSSFRGGPCALEVDRLTKRFGDKVAVDDVSFTLEPGTFLGLLGRNGAGKPTTPKMLTGMLSPTSGASGSRLDLARPLAVKRQVGSCRRTWRSSTC